MEVKNKSKNTINVTLKKSYEGFGRSLIMRHNEIRDIPRELYEEPEVEKYFKKGIIVNVVSKKDKDNILASLGAVENSTKKSKKIKEEVS